MANATPSAATSSTTLPVSPQQLAEYTAQHWQLQLAVVRASPVPFITSVVVFVAIAMFLQWLYFRSTMSALRAQNSLKDDQLNDATRRVGDLAGVPSGDLKARLDVLERNFSSLQGRSISDSQRVAFAHIAKTLTSDFHVLIRCNPLEPEAEMFAKQLLQLFRDNKLSCGWHYEENRALDLIPLALIVPDPGHLHTVGQNALRLLQAANMKPQIEKANLLVGDPYPALCWISIGHA